MLRINSFRVHSLFSLISCLFLTFSFNPSPSLADGLPVGSWSVRSGSYQVSEPGQNAYYLTDSPMISGKGEVMANVTIQRRNYPGGWATAGLLIATGSDNFWNLGLVEGPDGLHYTELVEQYQGVNQAQTLGSTRLIPVSDTFGTQWQYGKVYHLRLTLAPNRIDGFVYEEGKTAPIAHWGYRGRHSKRLGGNKVQQFQLHIHRRAGYRSAEFRKIGKTLSHREKRMCGNLSWLGYAERPKSP
jgi:hypothetical protein